VFPLAGSSAFAGNHGRLAEEQFLRVAMPAYLESVRSSRHMPHENLPVDIEIVISGLILLIGGLYLLANLDVAVVRQIVNLIWPLSLIATGVYGILLHNWRERER
jgi:hypothetical protein